MTRERDDAFAHLAAWASRGKWRERLDRVVAEHVEDACRRFDLAPAALRGTLGEVHHANLLGCALEDFATRRFDPKRANVIDDYLDHRAWRESPSGREYLWSVRDAVMSLHEVVDLTPGSHLVLRDLIRGGAPVTVYDRLGSQGAARWDRLGARILTIGEAACLSGAVLHFDHEPADSVLRILRKSHETMAAAAPRDLGDDERASLLTGLLAASAPAFSRVWLTSTLAAMHAPPPRLVNFDGDVIVLTSVRLPIAPGGEAQAQQALDRAPGFERDADGQPQWTWHAAGIDEAPAQTAPAPAATPTSRPAPDASGDHGSRILGHVSLERGAVVLETNSVNRANRGAALLTQALGNLAGAPLIAAHNIDRALNEREGPNAPPSEQAEPIPADIQACVVHPYLERHYRQSLDQPIPMLDGQSPRAAVRTVAGCDKVVAWLKSLENMEDRGARRAGRPAFDFSWMWRELGIPDLRK